FHGRRTASGERYDKNAFTAAHKTLPFGTIVRVTAEWNQKSVEVRITGRGPFKKGRVIDLSTAAAAELGMLSKGVGDVTLVVVAWPQ
ncbi:MAG: septal ring lytic transglycosylase RlpA family protein, partial [Peptococcaceae bacterium]|nr:septal ring lytic transglycosylase RlpA family protein [Peptococcaceae bacterium]